MNITEIAQRAGVSRSTVSRVLNNSPSIRDETRRRVMEVIKENNYIPSAAARSLVSQRSNIIGVMFYNLTQPFWAGMIDGIESGVAQSGYDLFFVNSKSDLPFFDVDKQYKHNLDNLIRRDVDGVILSLVNDIETEDIDMLHRMQLPYVIIQSNLDRTDVVSINIDNYKAARDAILYLIGLGHRNICHVTGPVTTTIAKSRMQGFISAMKESGLPVNPDSIINAGHHYKDGYWAIKQILHSPNMPTAVFFSSDSAAWGGIRAASEAGIRVPEDLSVIGFDGIAQQLDYAEMMPKLTTIYQPAQLIGEVASKMLLQWMRGTRPEPMSVIIPTQILIGETCKAI